MTDIPRAKELDSTLAFLREGYEFVGNRRRALGSNVFRTRLMLTAVVFAQGAKRRRCSTRPAASPGRKRCPSRRSSCCRTMAAFKPVRHDWDGSPWTFVPQGGGPYLEGHRRPGEWMTIALMKQAVRFLARELGFSVPEQDLSVDLSRIPAIPASRFLMDVRGCVPADRPLVQRHFAGLAKGCVQERTLPTLAVGRR